MKAPLIGLFALLVMAGCNSGKKDKAKIRKPFVFKETIVIGKDSGMVNLSGIRRTRVEDAICQHWELPGMEGAQDIDLVLDQNGKRIFPELALFNDSSYVENPRSHFAVGTWYIRPQAYQPLLVLRAADKKEKTYTIRDINSHNLLLGTVNSKGKQIELLLSADGVVYKNKLNDPFHPANNQWRIRPVKPESDVGIAARAKACVKFYALYYRDNIKRQKGEINFMGLPVIFEWYRKGIGLPDRDRVHESWVGCFYNKEQALKGYDILRELIVRYEFKWPENAPDWRYETRDVLEQMYHKLASP